MFGMAGFYASAVLLANMESENFLKYLLILIALLALGIVILPKSSGWILDKGVREEVYMPNFNLRSAGEKIAIVVGFLAFLFGFMR